MFPISYKVTFFVLFSVFKAEKIVSKLTLHHMGKRFNIRFGKIRLGIWRVVFLKVFFLFLCSGQFTTCALRWDTVYCLSTCVDITRSTRVPVTGNETGRLVKFEDLCRKWINKSETLHILRRDIAAASLKIWCEKFNPVKSYSSVLILWENTGGT